MRQIVASKGHFMIIKLPYGFIVCNNDKPYKKGHTHISQFNTAKYIMNLARKKELPGRKLSNWLLDSIIRISIDKDYIEKIENLKR